ncbi:MAG: topoisomerase IV, partial [Oscillospiraceae bacterium]
VYMALTEDYKGHMLFLFQNGKGAKVPLESYATKQNRKKLVNAFSDKSPLAWIEYMQEESEIAIKTTAGRLLLVNTAQIPAKATKSTAGVNVITLKKNQSIETVHHIEEMELANPHRYRVRTLPASGAILRAEDTVEQIQLTL